MWLIRGITRAHPLQILLIYALAIIAFAGVYMLWPRSFYHPYIRFEPAAQAQKAALEADLRRAIVAEFERQPKLSDRVLYRQLSRVEIAGEQDNNLRGAAEILVEFTASQNPLFVLKVPLLIVAFDLAGLSERPGTPVPVHIAADPGRMMEEQGIAGHSADERRKVGTILAQAIERVQLDKDQAALAAAVACAEQGIQCGSFGNLGRMLYFSAITITTVGYGDVVPLSPVTRFFATLEATFGIVLLGLFVVSLHALRAQSAQDDT